MPRKQPASIDRLARETGGRRKKWKGKLPIALVFPNAYPIGMSNLGFQLVYDLANRNPDIVCERVFLPEGTGKPLSLESSHPLTDFPVILCSVSFEQDYLNLVKMLRRGGVEPLAVARSEGRIHQRADSPLVLCGGVATFINPEPLAPFVDLFVIGEAEPVLPGILDFLLRHLEQDDRQSLLYELALRFPGCYAPHFYQVQYHPDSTLAAMTGPDDLPPRIKKVTADRRTKAGHSQLLSPDAEFADLFLAELGRGCSRGCRFCAAGFVYRPPRLWPPAAIIKALAERPPGTSRVGLLGMEMAKPADLAVISQYLLEESCSLSFSSLRADAVDEKLLTVLSRSGLKSAAIAPDGGSERLRRVINKGITEDDLLWAAESLVRAGVAHLKLYFMIGLPTETREDLEEMVALTMRIKKKVLEVGRAKGRLSDLTLSINSFVPKAWTPFQFYPMPPVAKLKEKLKFLRRQLAGLPNVRLAVEQPDKTFFQATLARGDRRVGEALLAMVDADRNWRQVFKEQGVAPEFYALRERGRKEKFPWEIVDHGINREYLWSEYQKALAARPTAACDVTGCKRCGVCR